MIRPVTFVTFLMACGSGLYLYQSKHEVQVLDHTIERIVRETSALREQSRLLATEWTVLNDPERLRQFSDTYLRLKTIAPSQFTSLADLDNRLPAPVVQMPPGETEDEAVPVTVDTGPQSPARSAGETVAPEPLPVPPVPAPHTAAPIVTGPIVTGPVAAPARAADVAAARPAEAKVAPRQANADAAPRSATVSDARSPEARAQEQRAPDQHAAQRAVDSRTAVRDVPPPPVSAPPRPIVLAPARPTPPAPVAPAAAAPAGNTGGSLLGMARTGAPPAPRPTPVNATYNAN